MANAGVQQLMGHVLDDFMRRTITEGRLSAILAAYERSKKDPETKLPTYLMAALEAAKGIEK